MTTDVPAKRALRVKCNTHSHVTSKWLNLIVFNFRTYFREFAVNLTVVLSSTMSHAD